MSIVRLAAVFADAAPPQKGVFLVLVVTALALPALVLAAASRGGVWERGLAEARNVAPLLGLLTGALNSFHMADTILRLPVDVTAKELAPGVFEVTSLIILSAIVGLEAELALLGVEFFRRKRGGRSSVLLSAEEPDARQNQL